MHFSAGPGSLPGYRGEASETCDAPDKVHRASRSRRARYGGSGGGLLWRTPRRAAPRAPRAQSSGQPRLARTSHASINYACRTYAHP